MAKKKPPRPAGKVVVGVPATSSDPRGAPILGERVLGHRDQADAGSVTVKG